MKPRASEKTEKPRRVLETPASIRPTGPPAPVCTRLVVELPEQKPSLPPGAQDSPAWLLAYNFLGIFSWIAPEVPETAESGVLAFNVEAAFLDEPPGVIPPDQVGPLRNLLREKLPAVIREANPELRTIIKETSEKRWVKVAAKFLRQPAPLTINEDITAFLNYEGDFTEAESGQGGPAPLTDEKYVQLTRQLGERSRAFRQQLGAELAPALNARIRMPDMPHETLEQKKELARWVNNQLEPLGLAVQCPNTGLPAKLKATTGHWPGKGRFHFEVYIDGQLKKPAASDTLPVLELMDAYPSKERSTHFQDAVGPRSSRAGRRRT